jgi:nucleotide-binding universal stress UspA family protein
MSSFDRILIALELGDEDHTTLAFADQLVKLTQPRQIDVVRVIDARPVPAAFAEAYPDLMRDSRHSGEQLLREQVAGRLSGSESMNLRFHVLVGTPLHELLNLSLELAPELIITGRSPQGALVETLPVSLARKAPCPLLAVPAGSRARIRDLLVPLDFSKHSAHALSVAAELAAIGGASRLQGLHAYSLPAGIQFTTKTEPEISDMMRSYAVSDFARFRGDGEPLPVTLDMEYVQETAPARAVLQAATAKRCDLVVLGARGGSLSGHALLGHVAARVLQAAAVPVLVTRRIEKGQEVSKIVMSLLG